MKIFFGNFFVGVFGQVCAWNAPDLRLLALVPRFRERRDAEAAPRRGMRQKAFLCVLCKNPENCS